MNKWDWSKDKLFSDSSVLKYILCEGDALDPKLELPRRCNEDYYHDLKKLFDHYRTKYVDAEMSIKNDVKLLPHQHINQLCNGILKTIRLYHNGFPAQAYQAFASELSHFSRHNNIPYDTQDGPRQQKTPLFRMRGLDEGCACNRSSIFHAPASLRHCLKSSRYSIAGYPSLYLTTSLSLAQRENNQPRQAIASRFEISHDKTLMVFDLGIRPQDFTFSKKRDNSVSNKMAVVRKNSIRNYLAWFPLLAACSFVRSHQDGFFSDEYIVPQLLLQWVRERNQLTAKQNRDIRSSFNPMNISSETDRFASTRTIEKLARSLEEKCSECTTEMKSALSRTSNDGYHIYQIVNLANSLAVVARYLTLQAQQHTRNQEVNIVEVSRLTEASKTLNKAITNIEKMSDELLLEDRDANPNGGDYFINLLFEAMQNLNDSVHNLDWLANRSKRIIGIRYFSCKDLYAPRLGRNYVFPTESCCLGSDGEEIAADGESGSYCASLNGLFTWTNPVKIEDFASLNECESHLISCEQLDNLHKGKD